MKPRHKIFWLNPDDADSNSKFVEHLDNGWAPAFYMPIETSAMIVLWKQTDALDGLTMAVAKEPITNKKNDKTS